jgi:hypothetical protein
MYQAKKTESLFFVGILKATDKKPVPSQNVLDAEHYTATLSICFFYHVAYFHSLKIEREKVQILLYSIFILV